MTTKVNSSVLDFTALNGYAANLKVGLAYVSTLVTGLTYANVLTAIGTDGVPMANVVTGLTYANVLTAISTNGVPLANVSTLVTGLTSANVTTALGYTPIQYSSLSIGALNTASASGNIAYNNTTGVFRFTPPDLSSYLTATSNVNTTIRSLGVGTAPSGTVGDIRAIDNITAFYSSDARLKENVADITNAVTTVASIGGKTFDWTDDYIASHGGVDGYFVQKSDFGVIAQDVQAVFPRAVRTRDNGMLAVDYEKLSALAFAAIRELSSEMQDLKAKIQELESKIAAKP
jgi:hypothetical protein